MLINQTILFIIIIITFASSKPKKVFCLKSTTWGKMLFLEPQVVALIIFPRAFLLMEYSTTIGR